MGINNHPDSKSSRRGNLPEKEGRFCISFRDIYLQVWIWGGRWGRGRRNPIFYYKKGVSFILPTFVKGNKIKLFNVPYKKAEIEIFNVAGRKLYSGNLSNVKIPFNKGSGTYIVIIKDRETGKKIKRKIIKLE